MQNWISGLGRFLKNAGIVLVILLVIAAFVTPMLLSFVDKHELGFTFNKFTGEIAKLDRSGYFVYPPWISVHEIDLRPIQLQITANANGGSTGTTINMNDINQRVLNAKLVRFNPDGLATFISWHGVGAGDSRNRLAEILRCYAFDRSEGRDCPFILIEKQLADPMKGE